MRKTLLFLTLSAFLASPMGAVPEVEAAQNGKASVSKVKAKAKAKKPKSSLKAKAKGNKKISRAAKQSKIVAKPIMTPLRAVSYDKSWHDEDLHLRSAAVLVVDQKTGEALYSKNVDVPTAIASITKLMTAMVTLDAELDLNEEIVINSEDVDRLKGTGSRLALGTRLTREELLHLALIASENRAAAALSRAYPGGRGAFVAAMNRKARELGMKNSHFIDGTGLDSGNRATAADLVKMVDAAHRYQLIRQISSTGSYDVSVPGTRVVRVRENGKTHKIARSVQRHIAFNNTNSLTRNQNWDIGVSKTGYINEAGHCLVMQTSIAEQKVIIVLLDSLGKWSRIGDAQRIRKWLEHDSKIVSHHPPRAAT
ncbi:MAG: serine hydrolase [Pseudomonadota bacterium]|nr:serine hydrolase [Pseudomonadota bacterium]